MLTVGAAFLGAPDQIAEAGEVACPGDRCAIGVGDDRGNAGSRRKLILDTLNFFELEQVMEADFFAVDLKRGIRCCTLVRFVQFDFQLFRQESANDHRTLSRKHFQATRCAYRRHLF